MDAAEAERDAAIARMTAENANLDAEEVSNNPPYFCSICAPFVLQFGSICSI